MPTPIHLADGLSPDYATACGRVATAANASSSMTVATCGSCRRSLGRMLPSDELADVGSMAGATCGSGWTGDRCSFPLFHPGPHSNGGDR